MATAPQAVWRTQQKRTGVRSTKRVYPEHGYIYKGSHTGEITDIHATFQARYVILYIYKHTLCIGYHICTPCVLFDAKKAVNVIFVTNNRFRGQHSFS